MKLYGAIYPEDTFLNLYSILVSSKSLRNTINTYKGTIVLFNEYKDIFDPDLDVQEREVIGLKDAHRLVCEALITTLKELVRLWLYIDGLQESEYNDETLSEFWRQNSVFSK